jgi:hypothetical protein
MRPRDEFYWTRAFIRQQCIVTYASHGKPLHHQQGSKVAFSQCLSQNGDRCVLQNCKMNSNPCDVCFNLQYSSEHDNQPLNVPQQVDAGRNILVRQIDDFKTSSTQGCPMCQFIVQAVLYFELPPEDCHLIVININGSSEAVLFFTGTCTAIQVYTPTGMTYS